MSKIARFPQHLKTAPGSPQDPRSEGIAEAIRGLIGVLSAEERDRILLELTEAIRPIATPRAGDVLGTIVRLLPQRQEWTVEEIKERVASQGVEATSKEIYNAIGYLARKRHIRRISYGRYFIEGVGAGIVSTDELGGEPTPYEDG